MGKKLRHIVTPTALQRLPEDPFLFKEGSVSSGSSSVDMTPVRNNDSKIVRTDLKKEFDGVSSHMTSSTVNGG